MAQSRRIVTTLGFILILAGCDFVDPHKDEAIKLYTETEFQLDSEGFLERFPASAYVESAIQHRHKLNEFLNRPSIKQSTSPEVAKVRELRNNLIDAINRVRRFDFQNKYRPDLPTVGTDGLFSRGAVLKHDNDIWDHGLRVHLKNREQISLQTSAIYGGVWRKVGACGDLRALLQSEFPNEDILKSFEGKLTAEVNTPIPDYQMVVAFDLALGRYDTAKQTFSVDRVLVGDEHPSFLKSWKGWKTEGNDIVLINQRDRKCPQISTHPSKATLKPPKEVDVN